VIGKDKRVLELGDEREFISKMFRVLVIVELQGLKLMTWLLLDERNFAMGSNKWVG